MRNAADFDRFYAKPDPWQVQRLRFRDRVLHRLISPYVAGRSVLELGCGEGHLTETIFSEAQSVAGVDISEVAIERAQARKIPNATFKASDFLSIPLHGYDVIAAIECLNYLSADDQEAFLDRLTDEHRGKIFVLSATIVGALNGRRYFTHDGIVSALTRRGFDLIEARNVLPRWDSSLKRLVGAAIKAAPLGDRLVSYIPEGLIYQRCYVARTS